MFSEITVVNMQSGRRDTAGDGDEAEQKLKEYPFNLLYAQNMLNMAQCQAHQWDVYAFLMSQQLAVTRLESAMMFGSQPITSTSSTSTMIAPPSAAPQPPPVAQSPWPAAVAPAAPNAAWGGAQAAAGGATPAVVAAQPQPPPDAEAQPPPPPDAPPAPPQAEGDAAAAAGNNPDQAAGIWQRFRIGSIVKVALIMILLEVKPVWFFVYFFAVFLYLGGIFDPIVDWFKRHAAQQPLDAQLRGLRRREEDQLNVEPEDTPASDQTPGQSADGADAGATGSAEQPAASDMPSANKPEDATSPIRRNNATGGEEVAVPTGAKSPARKTDAQKLEEQQRAAGAAIPWVVRFCYQLFVMFVMTLLPMWNPDPVYLQ